ncbi:siderophore ABC transporter substrate-binding protein [Macrococcus animalis]|uniref:siderophore ABC transporter substrate-binding protein n=1 Tax=Macrococcus animalis TaxID=3395467 RepID=UPI0039BE7BF7
MKKYFSITFILLLLIVGGCNRNIEKPKEKDEKTVTMQNDFPVKEEMKSDKPGDLLKHQVKVQINPQKVIVMDLGALDMMKQLKLKNHVVGITKGIDEAFLTEDLSDFKGEKYVNIGNPGRPNFEKIAELSPDVIFLSFRQAHTKTLDEIKKAAPDAQLVYMSPNDDDYINSVKNNMLIMGKIFEKETEAKSLNKKLDSKVIEVKKLAQNNQDRIMFLDIDEKGMKIYGNTGRFGGFLNREIGIKPIDKTVKATSKGHKINFEYISKLNPERIFTINRLPNAGKQLHTNFNNPLIKSVKAVKNNRITQFDANSWYFTAGGIESTLNQLEEIEKGLKK